MTKCIKEAFLQKAGTCLINKFSGQKAEQPFSEGSFMFNKLQNKMPLINAPCTRQEVATTDDQLVAFFFSREACVRLFYLRREGEKKKE